MKKKLLISGLSLLMVLFVFSIPPVEEGKAIFISRCASCHNVNKIVLGPALRGVAERHSEEWIINFVQSSQTVIKGRDKTAIDLYEKFNKVPMPDHADLTAANIKNILAYIKEESQAVSAPSAFRPEKQRPSYTPIAISDYSFFAEFFGVVILLASALLVLVQVKEIQRKQRGDE
jgi:cytochrome c551/c552